MRKGWNNLVTLHFKELLFYMLSVWAFILFGKWILFQVPRELFLVAFAQATIWAECLLDRMKYRLRLAARQHRPPTGHAGNEKEAKGQVSWTGKIQCKINNGNPSGHRCCRETAYDIITARERQHFLWTRLPERQLYKRLSSVSAQPTIRDQGLRTNCSYPHEWEQWGSVNARISAC